MEKELKKLQGAQKQAVYVERENAKCAAAVALPGGAWQPDRAHPRRRPTGTPRTPRYRRGEGARSCALAAGSSVEWGRRRRWPPRRTRCPGMAVRGP